MIRVATNTEMVVVGRLGTPFGVKGWVHVSSFTDPPENLLAYRPWNLRRRSGWQAVQVEAVKPHQKGFVALLDGVSDRDAAFAFNGAEIGVSSDVLPAPSPGEYYWKDLIGLRAERMDGALLGQVESLLETGAHDVLVIKGERGEVLVPFVDAVVKEVDIVAGRLVADWDPDY